VQLKQHLVTNQRISSSYAFCVTSWNFISLYFCVACQHYFESFIYCSVFLLLLCYVSEAYCSGRLSVSSVLACPVVSGAAGAWRDWDFSRQETYPGGRNDPPPPLPKSLSITRSNLRSRATCCPSHSAVLAMETSRIEKTSVIHLVKRREKTAIISKTYSCLFMETCITLLNNFVLKVVTP